MNRSTLLTLSRSALQFIAKSQRSLTIPPLSTTKEEVSGVVTHFYENLVLSNKLEKDARQADVVQNHFQPLYDRITRRNDDVSRSTSWAESLSSSWLFFKFMKTENNAIGLNHIPGVYLWGSVGGGKTMLMDLFHDVIKSNEINVEIERVHFHHFMQQVHELIHESKRFSPPRDISRWDTYQPFDPIPHVVDNILKSNKPHLILCLDEMQVTDIADAMVLKRLFKRLYEKKKNFILIVTSNRPPDQLYKNGLQRSNFIPFIDLIDERCEVVSLESGIDYRRKMASTTSNGSAYFFVDPDSDSHMNNLFKYLSSQETDSRVTDIRLRIKGRDVGFERCCGRILFSSFHELCDRPLWTNDYLKLCSTFHTVFIRNIPPLNRTKLLSQTRRFISAIDTFYDHRVRVVCSTDGVSMEGVFDGLRRGGEEENDDDSRLNNNRLLIDDLGIKANSDSMKTSIFSEGEEEAFAFERTLSRLFEMQTDEYWKLWDQRRK